MRVLGSSNNFGMGWGWKMWFWEGWDNFAILGNVCVGGSTG